jgi:hypothetical protein
LEALAKLDVQSKPTRMDIGSAQAVPAAEEERYTEAEYNEWYYGYDGAWPEEPEEPPTDAAERPALDAFGKNGKGKGKGGDGKGKGKGGKGKGKSGKGKGWTGGGKGQGSWSGKGAWVERRWCHKCGVQGHIAKDCPDNAAKPGSAALVAATPASVPGALPTFSMLRVKAPARLCSGFSGGCSDGNCLDSKCKDPERWQVVGKSTSGAEQVAVKAVMSLPTSPTVSIANKYQGLESNDVEEEPADGGEMPLPSTKVRAKTPRGRMCRWTRLPQKERRKTMVAEKVDESKIVVGEEVHGKTASADRKEDGNERELEQMNVADRLECESTNLDSDGDSECPNGLSDSDDEEDVPDCLDIFLSKHQLERRRLRLQRERTERIREQSAEIARLEIKKKQIEREREKVLLSPLHNRPSKGLVEGRAQSLTMAAGGDNHEHAKRAPAKPKPTSSGLSSEDARALRNYDAFAKSHNFEPPGGCTIEMVRNSSAGVREWARDVHSPDTLLKVGKGVASHSMCALWAKQALSAVSALPQWEKVVLTVDSGASDTVLPPHIASNVPLLHSTRVGTEYEVANGGVVVNLGERKAEMRIKEDGERSMIMSFQVVEVHKPLLAVSRLVEAGHKVCFDKSDPHILLSTGVKMPMRCNLGTYEVDVWLLNPGFTGPR